MDVMFEARSDEEIEYAGSAVGFDLLGDRLDLLPVPSVISGPLDPL